MIDHRLLSTYLNNHLSAASAGVDLFRRAAASHRDGDRGAELYRLADEIAADRRTLRGIMQRLEVEENKVMQGVSRVGERLGRLKPNGYLVSRSPLSELVELEALRDAVAAKKAGWQVLRALAVHDDRVMREEMETLLERADDQGERLYKMHLRVAEEQFEAASTRRS